MGGVVFHPGRPGRGKFGARGGSRAGHSESGAAGTKPGPEQARKRSDTPPSSEGELTQKSVSIDGVRSA